MLMSPRGSTWRHALIGILNDLDPRVPRGPNEGMAKRIQRLSIDGIIPREVAAMMRVVTEMRNMTEYQAKVLSASESAAVISSRIGASSIARSRRFRCQMRRYCGGVLARFS